MRGTPYDGYFSEHAGIVQDPARATRYDAADADDIIDGLSWLHCSPAYCFAATPALDGRMTLARLLVRIFEAEPAGGDRGAIV